ncbi:glycosyltransferase [Ancylomarina subtilis]|nr:glycosyltransferase [Ancylomarina subtilis]
MEMEGIEFTIIVPVFNEEENLLRLESELSAFLQIALVPSRVLFVNDGSTDNGQEIIELICQRNEAFSYISLLNNCGLSAAIKAGIDYCDSPYVGYIDSDLQTSPEDFNLLLEHRKDFALVTGMRQNRKDSFVKKMSSKIANNFRRFMTKDDAEDTGCPLKVIETSYAKKMPFFKGMHRFIPALTLMLNGKVKQVPVRHFPRIAGEAKYHLFNRLTGPFLDCFAYRWMKKRYIDYEISKQG